MTTVRAAADDLPWVDVRARVAEAAFAGFTIDDATAAGVADMFAQPWEPLQFLAGGLRVDAGEVLAAIDGHLAGGLSDDYRAALTALRDWTLERGCRGVTVRTLELTFDTRADGSTKTLTVAASRRLVGCDDVAAAVAAVREAGLVWQDGDDYASLPGGTYRADVRALTETEVTGRLWGGWSDGEAAAIRGAVR